MNTATPLIMWFGSKGYAAYRPYYSYFKELFCEGENLTLEALANVKPRQVEVLLPDDTLQVDIRWIKAFFIQKLHCCNINLTFQSLYLSRVEKKYISLTKTCRCIVMKYIKQGNVIQESFLPLSSNKEEIIDEIKQLHSEIVLGTTPLFIIDHLDLFKVMGNMGKMVTASDILANYKYIRANCLE